MRARRRAVALVLVGATSIAALVSCQIFLGDEPRGTVRNTTDANVEDVDAGPIDPCAHAYPPVISTKDDDTLTEKNYWFAMEHVDVGSKIDAGILTGVDLDRSCTCAEDLFDGSPTCKTPKRGVEGGITTCDTDGGVDDAFNQLLATISAGLAVDPVDPVNREITTGRRTTLIYLSKYNGKANDTDVGIAFVPSGGLYSNLGCNDDERMVGPPTAYPDAAAPELLPGPRYAPVWDGCDRWTPAPGRVFGDYPNRVTAVTAAYVVDHVLVLDVKQVVLNIFGQASSGGNGYVVARITPEGTGFRMDGIVATRIPFTDLVSTIGRTPAPNGGDGAAEPLCETSYWPQISEALCSIRDTMDSPAKDRTGQICNATTTTFGYVARPVQIANGEFAEQVDPSSCDAQVSCE